MSHRIGVAVQVNNAIEGQVIANPGDVGIVEQWPVQELDGRQANFSAVRFNADHAFVAIPDKFLSEVHPGEPAYRAGRIDG